MQRNAVSKIIVVTPLVVIMKDQVEQLQSIGIRALAIEVDPRRSRRNGSAKLFMKVMKACCRSSGGKNNNNHIVAIAIDEDEEVHSVTE